MAAAGRPGDDLWESLYLLSYPLIYPLSYALIYPRREPGWLCPALKLSTSEPPRPFAPPVQSFHRSALSLARGARLSVVTQ